MPAAGDIACGGPGGIHSESEFIFLVITFAFSLGTHSAVANFRAEPYGYIYGNLLGYRKFKAARMIIAAFMTAGNHGFTRTFNIGLLRCGVRHDCYRHGNIKRAVDVSFARLDVVAIFLASAYFGWH
jgi:hypothetical protein